MIQYGNGWIMLPSDYEFAPNMLLCPGATAISGGVAIPGTKVNFMALEAFGSFVASDEYVEARRAIMTVDEETIAKIKKRIRKWSIDPDELMPHQIQYIAERVDQPMTFNASEQGCIFGDAIVGVHRAGKSFKMRLSDLVYKFNGGESGRFGKGRQWDSSIPTKIRSHFDGHIRLTTITNAIYSGIKQTLEIKCASGATLRATLDHRILTDQGWKQAQHLSIGDSIVCGGKQGSKNKAPKSYYRTVAQLKHHPFSSAPKHDKTPYRVPVHRLVVEASINGLEFDEFVGRIKMGETDGLQFLDKSIYAVHHKDGDTLNNDLENLEVLTHCDHHTLEGAAYKWKSVVYKADYDQVVSITIHGFEHVYDLTVEGDDPNFLANNLVVHNCGKTLMTLVDLRMKGVSRVLLIGPRDVCLQWGDEIRDRKIDFLFHSGISGSKEERLKVMNQCDDFGGIFAVNFEMVDTLEEELKKVKWEAIVVDEGYRIKNHNAQASKACHRLAKFIPNRMLLNGTPIGNHVGDFYAQIKFLLGPTKFLSYADFKTEFINTAEIYTAGGQKQEVERGCKDPIKLMYMLEPLWFRATKETCLSLPPMVQQTLWFDMPTEIQQIYARTAVEGEQALGYEASLSDQRVVMLRLQQICGGHIPIYTPTQVPIDGDIDDYEEIPGFCYEPVECAKLRWLSAFVKQFVGGDPSRRIIVWCRFTSEVLRIVQELRDILEDPAAVAYVTGAVGPEMVGQIKLLFNSRRTETVRVIVAQISKMYNGHNLQAGDVHIHYNHTWSYIMKDQSSSRSHRHGREDRVDIINLAYRNSIDQGCLASLARKRDLSIKMSPDTIGKYS